VRRLRPQDQTTTTDSGTYRCFRAPGARLRFSPDHIHTNYTNVLRPAIVRDHQNTRTLLRVPVYFIYPTNDILRLLTGRLRRSSGAERRRLAARHDAKRPTTNAWSLCGRCDPQGRPRLFPFPTDLFGTEGARRFQHSTTRSYYFTCVLAPLYSNCHITNILGNILIIKYLPLRWSK